jgi:hypothetical protein
MLTQVLRYTCAAFTVAVLAAAPASAAHADGGTGSVNCSQDPSAPECDVTAGTPAEPGTSPGGADDRSGGSGQPSNCHYKRAEPQAPPPPGGGPGAWYTRACLRPDGGASESQPMWLTDAQAADPGVLAEQAVSRLRPPAPLIRTSPDMARAKVLVSVPVWLWVGPSSWGSRSATAAVPGMSVTATATPTRAVWRLGDGTVLGCGPGTPWKAGMNPAAESPTCGHTYRHAGPVEVVVTVLWRVTWAGGGQSGEAGTLTTTSRLTARVDEVHGLVTTGSG